MEEILNSNWFIYSGYAFGVIGIMLSILFFLKSKKEKRPCCINRSNNLIYNSKSELDDLQITAKYKGEKVETLSYTKVAFWNAGRETINGSDISKIDPLRLHIIHGQLYDFEIIYATHKANNFSLFGPTENNEILINFDFIDYNQGVIIKLVHSGNTTSFKSDLILCKGVIRGATKIEKPNPSFPPTSFLSDSNIFYHDTIFI